MKILSLMVIATILTSCSNLSFEVPSGRMISPEAQGEFLAGHADLRAVGTTKVIIGSATPTVPNSNGISMDQNAVLSAAAEIGTFKYLDFYVTTPYDSPNIYGLKFQFIGDPRIKAKKGFSAALAGGYGSKQEVAGDLISGYNNYEVDALEASLILGYRTAKSSLIYGGSTYTDYKVDANSTVTSNTTLPLTIEADILGAHLGFMWTHSEGLLNIRAEVNGQQLDWETGQKTTQISGALAIGVNWEGVIK